MSATPSFKERKKRTVARSPSQCSRSQEPIETVEHPNARIESPEADNRPPLVRQRPPIIPFKSFKIALSIFKEQDAIPAKFDRSIWSSKLYSTNLREILEAFRFLGLMDNTSTATPAFARLVTAYDSPAWPAELRHLLERAFEPLLASQISTLTDGGLLKVVKAIYGTEREDTRRCSHFFIHAAREAAMDIAPFVLNSSRSRWTSAGRNEGRKKSTSPPSDDSGLTRDAADQTVQLLIEKLPNYDSAWPDEIKRQWFAAYSELLAQVRP